MSASFERGYNTFKEVLDAPIASFFCASVNCNDDNSISHFAC